MVAPASMAASTTSQRKSISVRAASSGLNSTSAQYALGPPDARDGPLDDLAAGHLELVLAVDGRGGEEDVDARASGRTGGPPRRGRCRGRCSGRGRRRSAPATSAAMARTASKSPGRGDREPGLDDVDAERRERPGDLELLGAGSCSRRATARRRAGSCRRSGCVGRRPLAGSSSRSGHRSSSTSYPAGSGKTKKPRDPAGWAGLGASCVSRVGALGRRTLRPRPADKAEEDRPKSKVRPQGSHDRDAPLRGSACRGPS